MTRMEQAPEIEFGIERGQVCWRDGCQGVIGRHDGEGCSCHINPPCGDCTTAREYCPICDWDASEEVGGVMITLAALCLASGLDMHEAGETELARIWTKVDAIRAKQAAKPTGSALPIAAPPVLCQRTLEAAAKVVQEMPDPILTFYDRGPNSPPGNSYQPLKRSDLVNAILALGKDDR